MTTTYNSLTLSAPELLKTWREHNCADTSISLSGNFKRTIEKAIDDGYKVGVLFVDFKKAFDTVDHTILKSKLSFLGVSGVFHEWIASYIHERSPYVKVNDAISKLRQIPIGVPQGSLLGPRLFSIYVYDLPNSSETGCIHMFADGTTIYYIGKEVEEIIDALNHILNDFRVWCCNNHLTVHTGKTEAMLISNHSFVGPLRPVMFGNSYIHFTTKATCLGVEIDYKLNWKPHVTPRHNSLPDQLTALFETCNTNTNYNLRRTNHFSHVRYNSNIGRNSVRYRGPIVWNLIPRAIKDASSYQLFKQKLRQASKILDQLQFEKEACLITSKRSDFLYF